MACDILCLNCQGIRGKNKRNALFSWLNKKRCTVAYLQETHSLPKDEDEWKKEWGGDIYYFMAQMIAGEQQF